MLERVSDSARSETAVASLVVAFSAENRCPPRIKSGAGLSGKCFDWSAWMSSSSDWEMPTSVQPKPENYSFDLEAALTSLVGLRVIVPSDAFTAETLGTERTGNGVLIRDGVVLTIGYLITEPETI